MNQNDIVVMHYVNFVMHYVNFGKICTGNLFQAEKSKAFKCGTFGASSLQQRYLATGDFDGKMAIWYV